MTARRAIDLAYEIIWGTRSLKDVHARLGEIIDEAEAEHERRRKTEADLGLRLNKTVEVAPASGSRDWFAQYQQNLAEMGPQAGAPRAGYGMPGSDYTFQRQAKAPDVTASSGNVSEDLGLPGADRLKAEADAEISRGLYPYKDYTLKLGFDVRRVPGLIEDVEDARKAMTDRVLGVKKPEPRCKTPRAWLEAAEDRRQAKRPPVDINEWLKARLLTSGACVNQRVVMTEGASFSGAWKPKLSRFGVPMKVVAEQEQRGLRWLKCEFPLESGETIRRWFADDGRLMLAERTSFGSNAKT